MYSIFEYINVLVIYSFYFKQKCPWDRIPDPLSEVLLSSFPDSYVTFLIIRLNVNVVVVAIHRKIEICNERSCF